MYYIYYMYYVYYMYYIIYIMFDTEVSNLCHSKCNFKMHIAPEI